MDRCLRCSGWAVPYGGGGVNPVTLTPNFEFPIASYAMDGKTMTANKPVTPDDIIDKLIFVSTNLGIYPVKEIRGELVLSDTADSYNPLEISSDGLTITFAYYDSDITWARFEYNA